MRKCEAKVCTLKQAQQAENEMLELIKSMGYDEQELFGIRLAVEEALINAIKHGHKFDESKTVQFSYCVDEKSVNIEVVDEGDGFTPEEIPDPRADENLEKAGGRGLMLMKAYMDEVEYDKTGNRVVMIKKRKDQ